VQDSVGYNRVTLSMMLGGASWAILALLALAGTKKQRWMVFAAAGVVAYGQALTGGRSGYVSWGAVGLMLCIVRWRKLLPLVPIVVLAICLFLPQIRDRMLQGVGLGGSATDTYEMTSGRNIAWPYVIAKIQDGPLFGFGREAMMTAGVYQEILNATDNDESFPHPHNAYLELLLDGGLLGFFLIMPFYFMVLHHSFRLFQDHSDPIFEAAGGVCCALVLALLVAGMGGETFYPREGAVGMWAAIGLMLRVSVQRRQSLLTGGPLFEDDATETAEAAGLADEPVADLAAPA
jgi:O-antigen ligase